MTGGEADLLAGAAKYYPELNYALVIRAVAFHAIRLGREQHSLNV